MPSWGELLQETQPHIDATGKQVPGLNVNQLRKKYIKILSDTTKRNVVAYYSGWLKAGKNQNVDINDGDITGFMNALKGLDCSKGLDLILHTPGGNPTATEGIVKYLRTKFDNDIRIIVPQMAMSAGTMLACAGSSIVMGAHSCLGPIDPQFNGIPAYNIVTEFLSGNITKAKELQLKYLPFIHSLFSEVNPIPVKAALNLTGYDFGIPRLPLTKISEENLNILEKELKKL